MCQNSDTIDTFKVIRSLRKTIVKGFINLK